MRWWIRKLYNMPMTDPRYLALTPEQIELEWEHYKLDNPKMFPEDSYSDPEYDDWEKEQAQRDESVAEEEEWEEVELEERGE